MIDVLFKPKFIKRFGSLENALQEEILEKIELLKDSDNHKQLKVHKLHGVLKMYYSFSVNYEYRIIFEYLSKKEVALLSVGDHNIYK
jgi:plasmid maintenance system killer protein